jgi:hypothetical protein
VRGGGARAAKSSSPENHDEEDTDDETNDEMGDETKDAIDDAMDDETDDEMDDAVPRNWTELFKDDAVRGNRTEPFDAVKPVRRYDISDGLRSFLLFPLDTMKTGLQANNAEERFMSRNLSPFGPANHVTDPYAGLGPELARNAISYALDRSRLTSYGVIKWVIGVPFEVTEAAMLMRHKRRSRQIGTQQLVPSRVL